jgi:hypothetical protein
MAVKGESQDEMQELEPSIWSSLANYVGYVLAVTILVSY